MHISERDAKVYRMAQRQVRLRWIFPVVGILVALIWTALIAYAGYPDLKAPLPMVIGLWLIFGGGFRTVDSRILGILDRYISADAEALEILKPANKPASKKIA